jgi:small nuclear ribonucleoprotein (snRNP)-like protein
MTIKEISEFSLEESVNLELVDGTTVQGEITSIDKQLGILSVKLPDRSVKNVNHRTIKSSYPVRSSKGGMDQFYGTREPGGGRNRK